MAFNNPSAIKTLFGREPSMGLRLLVLGMVCLALAALDSRTTRLESAKDALSLATMPLQRVVDAPRALSETFQQKMASRRAMQEQLELAQEERLQMETRLQKLSALEVENQRMRDLLKSSSRLEEKVLMAELLAIELNPNRHQVTLNRGTTNGSFEGQPLIDSQGIIGQVTRANRYSSTATLVTDISHAIPVEVNRSGVRGIARGTGKADRLQLSYIPADSNIQIGDLLVSSGIGGSFPSGYPVAKVTAISQDPTQAFATVVAKPVGQFDRRRHVLLVAADPDSKRFSESRSRSIAMPSSPSDSFSQPSYSSASDKMAPQQPATSPAFTLPATAESNY